MRLLIVGAGPRGIEHGEAIRELPGWTVAGVVDPRLEARERAANSLGAATFANLQDAPPAVTFNHYGKGRAVYVATPAQPSLMRRLYREILPGLGIEAGPATPPGVYARAVDGRVLYVNTTDSEKLVKLARPGTDSLRLPAFGVELIDFRQSGAGFVGVLLR